MQRPGFLPPLSPIVCLSSCCQSSSRREGRCRVAAAGPRVGLSRNREGLYRWSSRVSSDNAPSFPEGPIILRTLWAALPLAEGARIWYKASQVKGALGRNGSRAPEGLEGPGMQQTPILH